VLFSKISERILTSGQL